MHGWAYFIFAFLFELMLLYLMIKRPRKLKVVLTTIAVVLGVVIVLGFALLRS